MDTTESLGDLLAARGLAIGETARRAKVRRETLWRWINGRSVPQPPQARALARVLQRRGETLDELTLWILTATRRAVASYESQREAEVASA